MIQRAYFETIAKRIDEPRKFIQKSDLRELFE